MPHPEHRVSGWGNKNRPFTYRFSTDANPRDINSALNQLDRVKREYSVSDPERACASPAEFLDHNAGVLPAESEAV